MANTTDTQIPQLIINKLTKAQYEAALNAGTISETEFYAVTDEDDYVTVNTFNNTIANYTTTENLANVALSGEYSDLLNKPTISTVGSTGEYSDLLNAPSLATVATSGEYGDLLNTPTIDQTYDGSSANAQSGVAIANLIANYSTTDAFSNVAFSGDFADLTNVPAAATVDQTYNGSSTNAQSGTAIAGLIVNYTTTENLANVALSGEYSDLLNTPSLATVATSGEYSDLLNKPTIDQTYNASSTNAQSGTAVAGLIANYMTSTEVTNAISNAISTVYKYKGSVATYAELPSSGQQVGDVWNVDADGHNYAWTGTEWDRLAGTVDLSNYVTLNTAQTVTNKTINLADNTVIGLSAVATSGEYSDLLNKPTIDQTYNGSSTNAQSGTAIANLIANYSTTDAFSNVAFSGDFADLTNTPTIDQTYNGSSANAQSGTAIAGLIANYTTTDNLANVALSGEYSDLLNTPTVDQTYNGSSTNAQSGTAVANAISDMQIVTNMVDNISNTSTNTTYPTASAVYNAIANLSGVVFRDWGNS